MFLNNIVFVTLGFVIYAAHSEDTKVTIKLGTIHGFEEKIEEKEVNVFLGIPFALPPIENLRFKKPQPITEKWSEPLDATKWPNICMQDTLFFKYYGKVSEDCLYLNVWTPVDLGADFTQSLKPVMVFIHGGGFQFMGTSFKHYNASVLSSFGDVVVVTMNYRLGAFGFLASGNGDAPGNVGLYDQALALEWVQDNIAYFGGDPKKVTLFGESAGAWSVGLHLLSPISQDTFNQAIMMSGTPYYGVLFDNNNESVKVTIELSKLFGCSVENEEQTVTETQMECLRKVEAKKFIGVERAPQISNLFNSLLPTPFRPVVGETLIPKSPKEMIEQKSVNSGVNVLVGTTANEGFVMHMGLQLFGKLPKTNNLREIFQMVVKTSYEGLSDDETEAILSFYFNGIDEKSDEAKMSYYTALGDLFFNCETVYFAESVSKTNDVYQYLFDYPIQNVKDNLSPCDLNQACHGNDMPITFGTVSDPRDFEASKEWMKILTDFAKSGTVEWPKHTQSEVPYYEFKGKKSSDQIHGNFRSEACKLWKPLFEKRS